MRPQICSATSPPSTARHGAELYYRIIIYYHVTTSAEKATTLGRKGKEMGFGRTQGRRPTCVGNNHKNFLLSHSCHPVKGQATLPEPPSFGTAPQHPAAAHGGHATMDESLDSICSICATTSSSFLASISKRTTSVCCVQRQRRHGTPWVSLRQPLGGGCVFGADRTAPEAFSGARLGVPRFRLPPIFQLAHALYVGAGRQSTRAGDGQTDERWRARVLAREPLGTACPPSAPRWRPGC